MKKLIITSMLGFIYPALACTTFATFNGENDSIVMAKNRDNHPDRQIIQVVAEKDKFKYLALSRQDYPNFVSAGVNEKNLAVFNEVTVEYSDKAVGAIDDDFSKDILQNYATAKAVIPDIAKLVAKYPDPVFYQVADSKQILSIEVAPDHKFTYKLTDKGTFTHTNNYQDGSLIKGYPYTASEKVRLQDSQMRLFRAKTMVGSKSGMTLDDMQIIALDHNKGPNNSIYRTGEVNDPRSVRSLAFFAVEIPKTKGEAAQFSANLYNMGERYRFTLDDGFWSQYKGQYTILSPNVKNK